ncbi:MAG: DUF6056 family protein [Treponema sp.]|nr:DUF6056 family protein [Treponema sp.]
MTNLKQNFPLYLCCVGIILLFFLFNVYTPLIADDYSYSKGINSVTDIIESQYEHYFNWGGRSIAHFFAQLLLLIGKPVFNAVNTLIYCAFIFLVYFHITGSLKNFKPLLYIIINITFWYITPAWGQNFLWLTGTCNYLWTTTIILLFLVPFRINYDNNDFKLNALLSGLFLFVGILAGWSNENSGAAVLFLLLAYFIIKKINKSKFYLFEILGLIGFLIGFILLIAAPGNYVRLEVIHEINNKSQPFIILLLMRFIDATEMFFMYGIFIIITIIFLALDIYSQKKESYTFTFFGITCTHLKQKKLHLFSYFYTLAAVAGIYSMILSPSFPRRAFFIVTVFSVISLFHIFSQRELKIPKKTLIVFSVLMLTLFSYSLVNPTRGILGVYLRWHERIEYIYSEKNNGNLDIEVPLIPSRNKYNALDRLSDISGNSEHWPNNDIAEYYGINSISANDEIHKELGLGKNIRKIIFPVWIFKFPQ